MRSRSWLNGSVHACAAISLVVHGLAGEVAMPQPPTQRGAAAGSPTKQGDRPVVAQAAPADQAPPAQAPSGEVAPAQGEKPPLLMVLDAADAEQWRAWTASRGWRVMAPPEASDKNV